MELHDANMGLHDANVITFDYRGDFKRDPVVNWKT